MHITWRLVVALVLVFGALLAASILGIGFDQSASATCTTKCWIP